MNNVIEIPKSKIEELKTLLTNNGLKSTEIEHGLSFRSNDAVITIYNSGKVLIQGKNASRWYDLILNNFNIQVKNTEERTLKASTKDQEIPTIYPRIGTDESGKGDFFGPLVTAAFLLQSAEVERKLVDLGVKDSKKLKDETIFKLSDQIKKLGPFEVVKIGPLKYNELYQKMSNVNLILAWSHSRAIENLLTNNFCSLIISDQFGDKSLIENALFKLGKQVQLIQMHKAEQDIAVAAASILARATFVKSIQDLSQKIGVKLPLGSGEQVINSGVILIKEKQISSMEDYAKTHFKTYEDIKKRL